MKTTRIVILISLALSAAAALADDLPAQAQRIWAPAADDPGQTNFVAASWQVADRYGDRAKIAEDWQLAEKYAASGMFGFARTWQNGWSLRSHGYGATEAAAGVRGRTGFRAALPGRAAIAVDLRGNTFFYDRDSERRVPGFSAPPAPPQLSIAPRLDWARSEAVLHYHVADGLDLQVGALDLRRDGEKASLLRGAAGSAVPAVKRFDTRTQELRAGGRYNRGALAADGSFRFARSDGQRSRGAGTFGSEDDQKRYEGRASVAYDATADTRVFASGALYRIESTPTETHEAIATPMDGDTDVRMAQLGVLQRFGRTTNLRLSAMVQAQDTQAHAGPLTAITNGVDRQRDRTQLNAVLSHTGLPRTALRLQYRYRATDLDESTGYGGQPGYDQPDSVQVEGQKRTSHEIGFTARYNLCKEAKVKVRARWFSEDIDQDAVAAYLYDLGDYTRDRFDWQVSVPVRVGKNLMVDLGHQGLDQTYERAQEGVETTWQATRGFANLNWLASDRITVYGTAAVGIEKYELAGGLAPLAGFAPFNYEGVTWRLMPGATWQVNSKVSLEGMYEAVFFTEDADESASIAALESNHDRILARVRYRVAADSEFVATYQRREFDENRWDDTIHDIYAISVAQRF